MQRPQGGYFGTTSAYTLTKGKSIQYLAAPSRCTLVCHGKPVGNQCHKEPRVVVRNKLHLPDKGMFQRQLDKTVQLILKINPLTKSKSIQYLVVPLAPSHSTLVRNHCHKDVRQVVLNKLCQPALLMFWRKLDKTAQLI